MTVANPIVLLPFLLSSSICLIAPVDFSLHLLNLFDTFLQLFVMMIQNRHDDRMKWYKLTGIGASRSRKISSQKSWDDNIQSRYPVPNFVVTGSGTFYSDETSKINLLIDFLLWYHEKINSNK